MTNRINLIILSLLVSTISLPVFSHDHSDNEVTPTHERERAQTLSQQGPKENQGIKNVSQLGTVDLSQEFPMIGSRQLRAREITIEPGGIVAVHQHQQRPGIAYILEGEITEHRNSEATSTIRKAGDVAVENSNVVHWWENHSSKNVRALIIDIIEITE